MIVNFIIKTLWFCENHNNFMYNDYHAACYLDINEQFIYAFITFIDLPKLSEASCQEEVKWTWKLPLRLC